MERICGNCVFCLIGIDGERLCLLAGQEYATKDEGDEWIAGRLVHPEDECIYPEGSGYYEELKRFLDGCPPEYWRDWVSDKATELEATHIKNKKSRVSEFLSQRLDSHKGESKR